MSDRLPQQIRYFNCIVIVPDADGKPQGKKYHNIKNTAVKIGNFLSFAKTKFPNATHVNFYNKVSRSFVERIYLEEQNNLTMGFTYTHIQRIDEKDFDALLEATNFVNQINPRPTVAVGIESKEPFKVSIMYNDLNGFFALASFFGQYVERYNING